jgi:predicted amidophosphoribosyltransferase
VSGYQFDSANERPGGRSWLISGDRLNIPMDITFNCPRCGQNLSVDETGAGMTLECPTCKGQIQIPRPAPPRVQASPPPPPVVPKSQVPLPSGLVICPTCKGTASREADRCPHCGHPIKRGFLGKAGTERTLNVGCLIIILVVVALMLLGLVRC